MLVTSSPITIDARLVQAANAQSPMLVTLSGIVTDVIPSKLKKAKSLISVTVSGITISSTSVLFM